MNHFLSNRVLVSELPEMAEPGGRETGERRAQAGRQQGTLRIWGSVNGPECATIAPLHGRCHRPDSMRQ
jgi:hypothetical protein